MRRQFVIHDKLQNKCIASQNEYQVISCLFPFGIDTLHHCT